MSPTHSALPVGGDGDGEGPAHPMDGEGIGERCLGPGAPVPRCWHGRTWVGKGRLLWSWPGSKPITQGTMLVSEPLWFGLGKGPELLPRLPTSSASALGSPLRRALVPCCPCGFGGLAFISERNRLGREVFFSPR